jgi:signal transduction histidine kinase/CheY-like chemotaxis protein
VTDSRAGPPSRDTDRHAPGPALAGRWRLDPERLWWDEAAARWLGPCGLGADGGGIDPLRWHAERSPADRLALDALWAARARPGEVVDLRLCPASQAVWLRGTWQGRVFEGLVLPLPDPARAWPVAPALAAPAAPPPVDALVGRIVHELRTPLQAIFGSVRLAAPEWPASVDAQHLERIDEAAAAMLRLVDDLLDLARVEAGTLEIEHDQPLDLHALVAGVLSLAEGLRQRRPLRLLATVDPACPRHLRGDAGRIGQVLRNLVANAVRFTDQGQVSLQVKLMQRREHEAVLRLSVADTGTGLNAVELSAMQPTDADDAILPRPRREGHGFGLAVVRGLLELHGTHLRVASVLGGGTLAWFDLVLPLDPGAPVGSDAPVASPGPRDAVVLGADERLTQTLALQWSAHGARCWPQGAAPQVRTWLVDADDPRAEAWLLEGEASDHRVLRVSAMPPLPGAGVVTPGGAWVACFPREAAPSRGRDPRLAGMRVLVVEDDLLNRHVMQAELRQAGVAVTTVEHAAQALRLARRMPWDAMLLDLHLPGADGLSLLRRLRAHPDSAVTPVLLVSAHVTPAEQLEALELGVRTWLPKPHDPHVLREALAALRPAVSAPSPGAAATAPVAMPDLDALFRQEWPRLEAAVRGAGAPDALRAALHALRGALSVMRRPELLAEARRLEEAVQAGRVPPAPALAAFLGRVAAALG